MLKIILSIVIFSNLYTTDDDYTQMAETYKNISYDAKSNMVQITPANLDGIKNLGQRLISFFNAHNDQNTQNKLDMIEKKETNNIKARGLGINVEPGGDTPHTLENYKKVFDRSIEACESIEAFKQEIPFIQTIYDGKYKYEEIERLYRSKVPHYSSGRVQTKMHKEFTDTVWGSGIYEEYHNKKEAERTQLLPVAVTSGLFRRQNHNNHFSQKSLGIIFAAAVDFEDNLKGDHPLLGKYLDDSRYSSEDKYTHAESNELEKHIDSMIDAIIYSAGKLAEYENNIKTTLLAPMIGLGSFASGISADDKKYKRLAKLYFQGYVKALKKYYQHSSEMKFTLYFFNYQGNKIIDELVGSCFNEGTLVNIDNVDIYICGRSVNIFNECNIRNKHMRDGTTLTIIHPGDANALFGNGLRYDFSMESMLLGRYNSNYITVFILLNIILDHLLKREPLATMKSEKEIKEEEHQNSFKKESQTKIFKGIKIIGSIILLFMVIDMIRAYACDQTSILKLCINYIFNAQNPPQ